MATYLKAKNGDLLLHPDGNNLLTLQEQVSFDVFPDTDTTNNGTIKYELPLPNGTEIAVAAENSGSNLILTFSADFPLLYVIHNCAWEAGKTFIMYKSLASSTTGAVFTIYQVDRYDDDELGYYFELNDYWSAAGYVSTSYTPVAKLKLANNKWTIQDKDGKDWYGFVTYSSYNG